MNGEADVPEHQRPKQLFRFFDHHGLSLLTHGTLKVTPPNQFNDPFEFWPGLQCRDYSDEKIRVHLRDSSHVRGAFQRRHPRTTDIDYECWCETTAKHTSLFIDELKAERDAVRNSHSRFFGVVCFSAFDETELASTIGVRHWACYAANHTGTAFEFDVAHGSFRELIDTGPPAFGPITYAKKRPDCDLEDLRRSDKE